MRRISIALSLTIALLASGSAVAKVRMPGIPEQVAAADVIVVGEVCKVTEVKKEAAVAEDKTATDGYTVIDVAVTNSLKGKASEAIAFVIPLERHNTNPALKDTRIFFLKAGKDKDGPYTLALPFTPLSISETSELDKVKAAIAAEKAAASQPKDKSLPQ